MYEVLQAEKKIGQTVKEDRRSAGESFRFDYEEEQDFGSCFLTLSVLTM